MKKNFDFPQIMDMEIADTAAGFFSNGSDDTPGDNECGWTIKTRYVDHNSGSHSVVEIALEYNGNCEGYDTIAMSFKMRNNFKLDYVKDSQGYLVTNVNEGGFVLTGTFHHNRTEKVTINIQIVVKNGPERNGHRGAAGITGVFKECDVVCTHHTCA